MLTAKTSIRWLTALCSYDCETTGVDPFDARIVTAHASHLGAAGVEARRSWLVCPDVGIPAAATAIHGVTNEHAHANGEAAELAVPAIATELMAAWATGKAVVVMNATYDLTVLQAELQRHEHPPLQIGPVLDPIVIDRAMDRYRKGKRTLTALAEHYEVKQGDAHSAEGDALTAARIIWRQAQRYRALADLTLEQMQAFQRKAHRDWAAGFEEHLRRQGKPESIDRDWPLRKKAA